jgi:hypothetical protein
MALPIKQEHTRFIDCDEIKNLRKELCNSTNYCLVKRNKEKYIRELIRFLILKLFHKDYKTEDNAKHEDVIIPLDNEVESLWILFISHTNDYKNFLTSLSSYYCDTTVFFARNFNLRDKDSKKTISRILYKNRYGTLPDFQIEDCFFESSWGESSYWEGSFYQSGKWKTGTIVYLDQLCFNPEIDTQATEFYFIGTLTDDDDNSINTGKLYLTDGSVIEYVDGVVGEVGDDESVETAIPVATSLP